MKIVIGEPKTGKSYQLELVKEKEGLIIGKHIGDELDGSLIGIAGYKFVITGGSDKNGFPMKADIRGAAKKRVLLRKGFGLRKGKASAMKKMVRGGIVSDETAQLNVKVLEQGPTPLEQLLPKTGSAEGGKKEEKPEKKK
ncbi:MAG: 30S ribosomal protein S6e [Candidatus Micrarchaeia archaeon]